MSRVVVEARQRGRAKPKSPLISLYPLAIEERYRVVAEQRVRALVRAMTRAIGPFDSKRRDAETEDLSALVEIAERVGFSHEEAFVVKGPQDVTNVGSRVRRWQDRHLSEVLGGILNIPLRDVLPRVEGEPLGLVVPRWVATNVRLIQMAEARFLEEVNAIITQGVTEGESTRNMAKKIEERGGVLQSRARFIARDQTAKLNSQITETRQRSLGVTQYRWRTSLDERVRELHRAREGKVFNWDDPPAANAYDGHPGIPPNCRCVAEPIIPDDLELFDDDD